MIEQAVEDFRRISGAHAPLGGSVASAAAIASGIDVHRTFGKPSRGGGPGSDPNAGAGVAACLKGDYSQGKPTSFVEVCINRTLCLQRRWLRTRHLAGACPWDPWPSNRARLPLP
jgi:hypothetical protein